MEGTRDTQDGDKYRRKEAAATATIMSRAETREMVRDCARYQSDLWRTGEGRRPRGGTWSSKIYILEVITKCCIRKEEEKVSKVQDASALK